MARTYLVSPSRQIMLMDAVEELIPTRTIKSHDSGSSKAPILVVEGAPLLLAQILWGPTSLALGQ